MALGRLLREEDGYTRLTMQVVVVVVGLLMATPIFRLASGGYEDAPADVVEVEGASAEEQVRLASDAQAAALLANGSRAAELYRSMHGTLEGFGPKAAAEIEPSVTFAATGVASQGVVSIRGVTARSVVLVTLSASGTALCRGYDGDRIFEGTTDAHAAVGCVGAR